MNRSILGPFVRPLYPGMSNVSKCQSSLVLDEQGDHTVLNHQSLQVNVIAQDDSQGIKVLHDQPLQTNVMIQEGGSQSQNSLILGELYDCATLANHPHQNNINALAGGSHNQKLYDCSLSTDITCLVQRSPRLGESGCYTEVFDQSLRPNYSGIPNIELGTLHNMKGQEFDIYVHEEFDIYVHVFVSRVIAYTKTLPKVGVFSIPDSVKKDIMW